MAADDITADDLAHLRPFALKVETHMPGKAFEKLSYALPDAHISTWKKIQARVAQLLGIQPELYDCCANSCICFVGPHAALTTCPHCKEDRYRANGQARCHFLYIPFTSRLKALLANRDSARRMLYRGKEHQHTPGRISDVMDSTDYRTLLTQKVVVDGRELPHKYFQDKRDIALGLSTDGFAPHRRRKKT
ncbi:hypothetical protein K466DRAFT_499669, partial [Polyporus arcularius HHB13444]